MSNDKLAERQRFEEWYTTHAHNYSINPIGSRDCALQWGAWEAALQAHAAEAAHPQPAQDAARLDWLEAHPRLASIVIDGNATDCYLYGISGAPGLKLREILDAAMARESGR